MLPCVANSPGVELDTLDTILNRAVAAFPDALRVGHKVLAMDAEDVYSIRDRIQQSCGENFTDSRLATHYAMLSACAMQVSVSFL